MKPDSAPWRLLRWLLTLPAAIFGWTIGVAVAIAIQQVGERWCPDDLLVSGACHAPWASFLSEAAIAVGALICGVLVVLLPALVAPSGRDRVAFSAYAGGLVCSVYWLLSGFWFPVVWAALGGAASLWRLQKFLARQSDHGR